MSDLDRRIARYLAARLEGKSHAIITMDDLSEVFGISKSTAKLAVDRLREKGKVEMHHDVAVSCYHKVTP